MLRIPQMKFPLGKLVATPALWPLSQRAARVLGILW